MLEVDIVMTFKLRALADFDDFRDDLTGWPDFFLMRGGFSSCTVIAGTDVARAGDLAEKGKVSSVTARVLVASTHDFRDIPGAYISGRDSFCGKGGVMGGDVIG